MAWEDTRLKMTFFHVMFQIVQNAFWMCHARHLCLMKSVKMHIAVHKYTHCTNTRISLPQSKHRKSWSILLTLLLRQLGEHCRCVYLQLLFCHDFVNRIEKMFRDVLETSVCLLCYQNNVQLQALCSRPVRVKGYEPVSSQIGRTGNACKMTVQCRQL